MVIIMIHLEIWRQIHFTIVITNPSYSLSSKRLYLCNYCQTYFTENKTRCYLNVNQRWSMHQIHRFFSFVLKPTITYVDLKIRRIRIRLSFIWTLPKSHINLKSIWNFFCFLVKKKNVSSPEIRAFSPKVCTFPDIQALIRV